VDELSARRTDLYLTSYGTYKRQTSMPKAELLLLLLLLILILTAVDLSLGGSSPYTSTDKT